MKKIYLKPCSGRVDLQTLQPLLNYSAQTSNPVNGGDPTGGNGGAYNPFDALGAPERPFDLE